MRLLRSLDRSRVAMDFLVHSDAPGDYDKEILALGSSVIACPHPRQAHRFVPAFLRVLRNRGPYDVVHSHVHHFSGIVLGLSALSRVPIRIAHSHLDTSDVDSAAGSFRRAYLAIARSALARYATRGLAVSDEAAAALFGPDWRRDSRWRIHRCALNFDEFREPVAAPDVRAELGIPEDALLVGHVGRFVPQKNHRFLLEIAAAILQRSPGARFVLVGDGPLRAEIERDAGTAGLSKSIQFLGVRPDIPRILRALDVAILPSLREGLPIVGLEAQASGVPLVLATTVTRQVEVVAPLLTWLGLDAAATEWAEAIVAAARRPHPTRQAALAQLERSEFSLTTALPSLEAEYVGA